MKHPKLADFPQAISEFHHVAEWVFTKFKHVTQKWKGAGHFGRLFACGSQIIFVLTHNWVMVGMTVSDC
jgi:hypothetical protein